MGQDAGRWSQELAFWPAEADGRSFMMRCLGELLAHLARWSRQDGNQCPLWRRLIVLQRRRLAQVLEQEPALRMSLEDPRYLRDAWTAALLKVISEVNCFDLPDACPWTLEQTLDEEFLP